MTFSQLQYWINTKFRAHQQQIFTAWGTNVSRKIGHPLVSQKMGTLTTALTVCSIGHLGIYY